MSDGTDAAALSGPQFPHLKIGRGDTEISVSVCGATGPASQDCPWAHRYRNGLAPTGARQGSADADGFGALFSPSLWLPRSLLQPVWQEARQPLWAVSSEEDKPLSRQPALF